MAKTLLSNTFTYVKKYKGVNIHLANKQAPETLTYEGFCGNSLPETFEISKLGNAMFNIFGEKKGINRKMTDVLLLYRRLFTTDLFIY